MALAVWVIISCLAAVLIGCALAYRVWRNRTPPIDVEQARAEFRICREHLEARFVCLTAESGKPRGLKWEMCEFTDEVTFARDRENGHLVAFVEIAVGFSAIEGGDMEDVEAVGNIRSATAVFQKHGNGDWQTQGRVIFNLSPEQTLERFESSLEPLACSI